MGTGDGERERSRLKSVGWLLVAGIAMAVICSIAVASGAGIVFGE